MRFPQRARAAQAGLIAMLALAFWTTPPASAQVVDRGNLVVTGSATPDPAGSGGPVTYAIAVKDDSTFTATGVTVTMTLPDGSSFVKCTPVSQPCQSSPGVVTTTFPAIAAHTTVKVNLVVAMPAVSQDTVVSLAIRAHADSAIGGQEPRDGTLTITSTILPLATRLLMSPSGRTVLVACGDTIDAAAFGADTEGQMLDGLVCNAGSGPTMTASGKTLNLGGKKIYSGSRVTGNAGITVGPNATNVTIKGGGTQGTKGVEQFDYCVKDLGGNTGLHITDLRCFRAKTAGILSLSDGVLIDSSLVDNTTPDTKIAPEVAPGGVGIQSGGDNLRVKDTIVRRSKNIGFWAYGVDTDGSGLAATFDGTPATARIETSFGVGALLSKGPHKIDSSTVLGDDYQTGTSKEGIVVAGDALGTIITDVVIKNHRGHGMRVAAGATGTVIERTSLEQIGGNGFQVDAPATLNGNSAQSVLGKAFLVNASAVLTSNSVERCSGDAFVVNSAAIVDSNSAIGNAGRGYVLTNVAQGSGVTGATVQAAGDFNGDGMTDLLWRQASGAVTMWLMNGPTPGSTFDLGTWDTAWTIVATGNFNADGKADILWRHTSGAVVLWRMNGPTMIGDTWLIGATDWMVAAVGDFNGDGNADILWRHPNGSVVLWLMNGSTLISATWLTGPTDWTIGAVADFSGDGKADILWRHSPSGSVVLWLMNGSSLTRATWLAPMAATWTPKVADFDGDGKADVLWRNTSGDLSMWLMDGPVVTSVTPLEKITTDWSIAAVGDFDGDHRADILWRYRTGLLSTWFMDGPGIINTTGAARLVSNTAESNTLGGVSVTGSGNVLNSNTAKGSGGRGFDIAGTGNVLDTNAAERSASSEFAIAPGNVDAGGNSANGTRFSFTAAGGTFE